MTITTAPVIKCPVCASQGDKLHHDIRAPLVYACMNCLHEWEIEASMEPPQADLTTAECPRTVSRPKRPRSRRL